MSAVISTSECRASLKINIISLIHEAFVIFGHTGDTDDLMSVVPN